MRSPPYRSFIWAAGVRAGHGATPISASVWNASGREHLPDSHREGIKRDFAVDQRRVSELLGLALLLRCRFAHARGEQLDELGKQLLPGFDYTTRASSAGFE